MTTLSKTYINTSILDKQWQLVLFDIILLAISFLCAFFVKYDFTLSQEIIDQFLHIVGIIVFLQITLFIMLGVYRSIWKYSGIGDLLLIIQATLLNGFLLVLFQVSIRTYLVSPRLISIMHPVLEPLISIPFIGLKPDKLIFPYAVIVNHWLISTLLIGGERFMARLWVELKRKEKSPHIKRLLVIGGGDEAETVLRELRRNPELPYIPVGIIDEKNHRVGLKIHGIKILGGMEDLQNTIVEQHIDEILIALPTHSGKLIRYIISLCAKQNVKIRTLPTMEDLLIGKLPLNPFPEIQPEHLMGREQVTIHTNEISAYLENRSVLITGAGGSIGSELCRQIAGFKPKQLILLGSGENSIYEIQIEMQYKFPNLEIHPVICNIQDKVRLEQVFSQYIPDVVFHAAAHKHVPLMELNPAEAIKNNIFGTMNVAECTVRCNSKRFIFISTDKAINPTSVMGTSKRISELIIECMAKDNSTKFSIVRFGNVLGSRGSVIPLFQKQILWGGPLTVTHPDATRYFMSIPEAVKLVVQAGSMADQGEIFALNMGEPIRILELAKNLISLAGLDPDEDIQIEFTGLRMGEKMTEESVSIGEGVRQTEYPDIFIIPPDSIQCRILFDEISRLRDFIKDPISQNDTLDRLNKIIRNVTNNH